MGANVAFSGNSYTVDTETDLYVNSSETKYAISLKLGIQNGDAAAGHNVELWLSDSSNVKKECLFIGAISASDIISDGSKTWIPPGYKIRFTSDDTGVSFSAHLWEMA